MILCMFINPALYYSMLKYWCMNFIFHYQSINKIQFKDILVCVQ